MDIIKDIKGECIYISRFLSSLIMYDDGILIDTKPITNFTATFNGLCKKLKCEDSDFSKSIINNIDSVDEVVFTSEGIKTFSLK